MQRSLRYIVPWLLMLLFGAPLAADSIRLKGGPPPGFEDLSAKQTTQADLFFAGEFVAHVFIEYDPYELEISDLAEALHGIPSLKDPDGVAAQLLGPIPTNTERLCNRTQRVDCGVLRPEFAAVIFDARQFRVDLFVHPDQVHVYELQGERYLPPSSVAASQLHNIRTSASGQDDNHRYAVTSESFLARRESRFRARYGVDDQGPSLYELAWQRDAKDMSYEIGSMRTVARNLSFASDTDMLGVRIGTSTKTRLDLDDAISTPIFLFLLERSRVDLVRDGELLSSRFYPPGNQQIDTSTLPDGAYDVEIRTTPIGGRTSEQTQFFVRSPYMPPLDEPQWYLEAGSLMRNLESGKPRFVGDAWLRAGTSRRITEDLAWDRELIYANGDGALQAGVFYIKPNWHLYAGAMLGNRSAGGVSLRGAWQHNDIAASWDIRHVSGGRVSRVDDYSLTRGGYTQGIANLSIPLWKGQMVLRARINKRVNFSERDVGFAYLASLFNNNGWSADLMLDGGVSMGRKWLRAGVTFRWFNGRQSANLSPRMALQNQEGSTDFLPELSGFWNSEPHLQSFGPVQQSVVFQHDDQRSLLGAKFLPREYPQSDMEFGLQRTQSNTTSYYALNNHFSIARTSGRTTIGDGGGAAGAIVVDIAGDHPGMFEVLIDNRVAGYAWSGRRNVVSVRPYETYEVKISPVGDEIVSFDQARQSVTIYPGNVETVRFEARSVLVLLGQAVFADGRPVARKRFANVEGYGVTDDQGWFQVEVAHEQPLQLVLDQERRCSLHLPDVYQADGLAIVDAVVCRLD
ncbi:MAG: TcfC E-set like domain-containing protein [Pseudomonadota bacterium]